MKTALLFLLPLALTLAVAIAVRVFAGSERASRWAGVAVPVGFFVSWYVVVRPGWTPVDDLARIGHLALGAVIAGVVLDFFSPRRIWTALVVAVYVLGAGWASVTGALIPDGPLVARDVIMAGVLAVGAFLVLARLDGMRENGVGACMILTVLAFGLALLAAICGDTALTKTGIILGLAVAAYMPLQAFIGLRANDTLILSAGAVVLGIAWAFVQRQPECGLALVLMPLVLFAEPTARRVPLPKARISAFLYPGILAGLASLPVILSAFIALVTADGR